MQITDDQINSDHWWTIPAEIRKIRREHQVYLSPEARKVYGKGLYQYSYAAVNFWTKREGAKWRIHDLRRTAATLMQEHGVASDIVDRCLGHQVGGRLAQAYQRATLRPAIRAAFEELGRQVARIQVARKALASRSNVMSPYRQILGRFGWPLVSNISRRISLR